MFNKNTLVEFAQSTQHKDIEKHLMRILGYFSACDRYSCFIWSKGAQYRKTYEDLKTSNDPRLRVLHYRSVFKGLWKLLYPVVPASYEGTVELLTADPEFIKKTFFTLGDMSLVGIYMSSDTRVVREMRGIFTDPKQDYDVVEECIKRDPSYCWYEVDFDVKEPGEPMYEVFSSGRGCAVNYRHVFMGEPESAPAMSTNVA